MVLMVVGMIGLGYVSWVYIVWGKALPEFPAENEFLTDVQPYYASRGFIDLLENGESQPTPVGESTTAEDVVLGENRLGFNRDTTDPAMDDVYDEDSVTLSVPRLDIDKAKVALDVDGENEYIYDGVLTRAVAHLQKSAYPGEYGNVFLFGHSKLPVLAANDYESIFTDLPKVKVGDVVLIYQDGKEYTYQITRTGVVDPDDVYIMNQPRSKKMVTLMTCIPPGFSNQRYITVGELIDVN